MRPVLFIVALLYAAAGAAQPEVERLLGEGSPPSGVVFEIVEGDEDALSWALPRVAELSRRLRARFPDLPIAVVTHGREQFGLLSREAEGSLAPIHADAQGLRASGIDLHVCGTHAGWYGHVAEDFPAYVDVSPSGPAQINDYERLDYEVVRLERVGE
jgi:intracellular sulfur oxidation DsrE/DsrF family protein